MMPINRMIRVSIIIACMFAAIVATVATRAHWMPLLRPKPIADQHADATALDDPHAGHDHRHAGHNEAASIELSNKGLKNIGFEPYTIEPTHFDRKLMLPAIVIERPGHSQLYITAPLTGIVTDIHSVTGEAIEPDQPLFVLRAG